MIERDKGLVEARKGDSDYAWIGCFFNKCCSYSNICYTHTKDKDGVEERYRSGQVWDQVIAGIGYYKRVENNDK
jgi:hypothetical protein